MTLSRIDCPSRQFSCSWFVVACSVLPLPLPHLLQNCHKTKSTLDLLHRISNCANNINCSRISTSCASSKSETDVTLFPILVAVAVSVDVRWRSNTNVSQFGSSSGIHRVAQSLLGSVVVFRNKIDSMLPYRGCCLVDGYKDGEVLLCNGCS